MMKLDILLDLPISLLKNMVPSSVEKYIDFKFKNAAISSMIKLELISKKEYYLLIINPFLPRVSSFGPLSTHEYLYPFTNLHKRHTRCPYTINRDRSNIICFLMIQHCLTIFIISKPKFARTVATLLAEPAEALTNLSWLHRASFILSCSS
jgi:hypothetical protein